MKGIALILPSKLDYEDVPRSAGSKRSAIGLRDAAGVAPGERRNVKW